MKLVKCPRCDLNWITESEKYCSVCLREMKGERSHEEVELCSICNQEPCIPGKDVCIYCLREMNAQSGTDNEEEEDRKRDSEEEEDEELESVEEMGEILPDVDEEPISAEMENELSLESVREDEEREADEEDEKDEEDEEH